MKLTISLPAEIWRTVCNELTEALYSPDNENQFEAGIDEWRATMEAAVNAIADTLNNQTKKDN